MPGKNRYASAQTSLAGIGACLCTVFPEGRLWAGVFSRENFQKKTAPSSAGK